MTNMFCTVIADALWLPIYNVTVGKQNDKGCHNKNWLTESFGNQIIQILTVKTEVSALKSVTTCGLLMSFLFVYMLNDWLSITYYFTFGPNTNKGQYQKWTSIISYVTTKMDVYWKYEYNQNNENDTEQLNKNGLMHVHPFLPKQIKLYLSQAPNTTGVDFTVKCLLTSP